MVEPEEVVDDDESEEISQEDAWTVISSYFEEKGLVRQQLDSFDEFIQNTMQEIVDESANIEIRPEAQHNPGRSSEFVEVPPPLISAWNFLFCMTQRLKIKKKKGKKKGIFNWNLKQIFEFE